MATETEFTLRQAIAWIAWHDPKHPLLPELPEDRGVAPLQRWLEARAELNRPAERSARELADKINAGAVAARGRRVLSGTPGSSGPLDMEPAESVPAGTAPQACTIPIEWLEVSPGDWLLINNRMVNGWDTGPRFCQVTVNALQVKRHWPLAAADHAALVACMEAEGRKLLKNSGKTPKRASLIEYCVQTMACTNDAAEAAHKDLPPELRRGRGERESPAGRGK